jgi:hypothetical protein
VNSEVARTKERRAIEPGIYRVLVVNIYGAATILALGSAYALYSGIHEFGGAVGWWPPSPNENDGAQFGLLLGGLPIIVIVVGAAAGVIALARRAGRAGWPAALVGSIWLILVVTVLVSWVLIDSIGRLSTP